MYEITDFTDSEVKIYNYFEPNSNIVKAGEDIKLGDVILKKGKKLGITDIGILVTPGIKNVKIYKRPKIGISATGDELIEIGEELSDGKIRNSNSYTIAVGVEKLGGEILFWKVKMKPGSPIAVGKYKDKLLFGLSGNRAATYITFELFVRPIIKKSIEEKEESHHLDEGKYISKNMNQIGGAKYGFYSF